MDYREEFAQLVSENRLEEARIVIEKGKFQALEDPYYYANLGWVLNHMERYQEAELSLRKGISYFPDDGWMYSQLGFSLNRQGSVEDGLETLLMALELHFDEPWLHGEIGWCYHELHDNHKAIEYFENALLEEDKNVWVISQAAYTYMELGDNTTAEEYFKKSYQLDNDFDELFDLMNFYKTTNRYMDVITFLTSQELGFKDYCAFEIGNAYYELGEDDKACEKLQTALELGKDDTVLRSLLGDVYLRLDKNEEADKQYAFALQYYEKALKKEEDTYWIYQEMIWIAHKQKDFHKKLQYLERVSETHEPTVWLMYHYARCYSDLYNHEQAIEACKYCLSHGENGKDMAELYAWNLGRSGREREAIDTLIESLKIHEADDWTYGELGWNYAQCKEYETSISYYQKALRITPDNAAHMSMLGWCHLRLLQLDQALDAIEQARALGREDGWIHAVLAEIYEAKEDYAEAITNYQRAIDLDYDEAWVHEQIETAKNNLEMKQKTKG